MVFRQLRSRVRGGLDRTGGSDRRRRGRGVVDASSPQGNPELEAFVCKELLIRKALEMRAIADKKKTREEREKNRTSVKRAQVAVQKSEEKKNDEEERKKRVL